MSAALGQGGAGGAGPRRGSCVGRGQAKELFSQEGKKVGGSGGGKKASGFDEERRAGWWCGGIGGEGEDGGGGDGAGVGGVCSEEGSVPCSTEEEGVLRRRDRALGDLVEGLFEQDHIDLVDVLGHGVRAFPTLSTLEMVVARGWLLDVDVEREVHSSDLVMLSASFLFLLGY